MISEAWSNADRLKHSRIQIYAMSTVELDTSRKVVALQYYGKGDIRLEQVATL